MTHLPAPAALTLSSEQVDMLVPEHVDMLGIGIAGSGKTMVAIERVRRRGAGALLVLPDGQSRRAIEPAAATAGVQSVVLTEVAMDWILRHPDMVYRREGVRVLPDQRRDELVEAIANARNFDAGRALQYIDAYSLAKRRGLSLGHGFSAPAAVSAYINKRFPQLETRPMIDFLSRYEHQLFRGNYIDKQDVLLLPMLAIESRPDCPPLLEGVEHLVADDVHLLDPRGFKLLMGIRFGKSRLLLADDDQAGDLPVIEDIHAHSSRSSTSLRRLQVNYRSGSLLVSQSLLQPAHSQIRVEKRCTGNGEESFPPTYRHHEDKESMLREVTVSIQDIVNRGTPAHQVAVLSTIVDLVTPAYEALAAAGLKAQMWRNDSAYSSPGVQLAGALVRFLRDPKDADALILLVRLAAGGDVEKTYNTAIAKSAKTGTTLEKLLPNMHEGSACMWLLKKVTGFRSQRPQVAIDWLIDRIGKTDQPGLALASKVLKEASDWGAPRLTSLILRAEAGDPEFAPEEGHVSVLPLENCGGLEFTTVHIIGYSEGLIPAEGVDIEEARRQSYRGISRASRDVFLHHASVLTFGEEEYKSRPSMLLHELNIRPAELQPKHQIKSGPSFRMKPG